MSTAKNNAKMNATASTDTSNSIGGAIAPIGDETTNKKPPTHPINEVLLSFLTDIRSIQKTHAIVLPHVLKWLRDKHDENSSKLDKYALESEGETDLFRASSAHQTAEILDAIRELDGLGGMRIPDTLQRSLFTQLFSEYDSFVGALLKVIYKNKGDLLKGISRQITFADLLGYDSLNAVKLDMLEKEVDTFRRDSYVEQFSTLESKFGLTLRSFPEWGEFIELSQRRNLIVHNGGCVSEQYLLVCDRENFKFDSRPVIGDLLKTDPKYFARAIIVVSKVAFMLCHTLWRKLFPNEKNGAHEAANDVLYKLLEEKRWKTADEIAKFCLTPVMRKDIDEIKLRIRTINAAIAAKFSGNPAECASLLKSLDWTASIRDFRLAILVLEDDFAGAAKMMVMIGKNGEFIEELSYHEWPLFHKFRGSIEFLNTYMEIYGISFIAEAVRHTAESVQLSQVELEKELAINDIPVTPIKLKPKRKRISRKSIENTDAEKASSRVIRLGLDTKSA